MSLPLDSALTHLARGAEARRADPRLEQRLSDVQRLFAEDLGKVEAVLAEAVTQGAWPGTAAAAHLVGNGGKRVRPLTLGLAARCFGAVSPAVTELAVVSELVHSATLLHDDVVDEGMERRGATTARLLFGNASSVLGGDLLLVHALDRTARVAPELMPGLILTLRRLVDGEIVQLRGRTQLDLSEATYMRILQDKTASLFSYSTGAGAHLAGASSADQERLSAFGEQLG